MPSSSTAAPRPRTITSHTKVPDLPLLAPSDQLALETLAVQLSQARHVVEELKLAQAHVWRNSRLQCIHNYNYGPGCGTIHRIKDLVLIQTHYSRRDGGETEWFKGEGRFVCPACGHMNRLHDRAEVLAYADEFKSIENVRS